MSVEGQGRPRSAMVARVMTEAASALCSSVPPAIA
jgi:hypothetical protein